MVTVQIPTVRELYGVEYDRQAGGAACPHDGCETARARVTKTLAWEAGIRIRYHKCQSCSHTFSSIEEHVPNGHPRDPDPSGTQGFRADPRHPVRR